MQIFANKKIKEHANEMPSELRRAIDALNDDFRVAIFFVLLKYGELPFSQIMNELEIPQKYSSKLTYHLKKLEKSSIIKNEYTKKEGVDSHSFYDLTEFGKDILNGLMQTVTVSNLVNEPIETTAVGRNHYINKEFGAIQTELYLGKQDLFVNDMVVDILKHSPQDKMNFRQPQVNIYNYNIKIEDQYSKEQKEVTKSEKVILKHENIEIYKRC